MPKVTADMSLSLDGFITAPGDSAEAGLGQGGEVLHDWLTDLASFHERHGGQGGQHGADSDILAEAFENVGAFIMGRRMFDFAEAAWGDNPPFRHPVFVVTHHARPALVKDGGTTFHFVTDGPASALRQAQNAAGDRDVAVAGGANIIQQFLRSGQLDELQLHLVPVLLGGGKRLFDQLGPLPLHLEIDRVIAAPAVTHLRYRLRRAA